MRITVVIGDTGCMNITNTVSTIHSDIFVGFISIVSNTTSISNAIVFIIVVIAATTTTTITIGAVHSNRGL